MPFRQMIPQLIESMNNQQDAKASRPQNYKVVFEIDVTNAVVRLMSEKFVITSQCTKQDLIKDLETTLIINSNYRVFFPNSRYM